MGLGLLPWTWFALRDVSVVMEVVAVLLPVLVLAGVVALVVTAGLTKRPVLIGAVASWVAFGLAAVFLPWIPHSTGHPVDGVTIAVANVLSDNHTPAQAVEDIVALDADIVVVPEDTQAIHRRLAVAYPFTRDVPTYTAALGVYSRLPATLLPPVEGVFDPDRYARVEIGGDHPFVLWALHLPRPWLVPKGSYQMRPGGHARTLSAVLDAIAEEDLPVVVAGDLNLTDRGRGYRKVTADLDDAMRSIRGARTSLKPMFRPLLLRIDHILEPEDWCADRARRFAISGSDHRGVVARIGPCASR